MLAILVGAAVAGLGIAVVFAVYRSGDFERVARSCAQQAVAQEREQIHRVLIANATALRKAGRRQQAVIVDQLLALLKARPLELEVDVRAFLPKKKRNTSLWQRAVQAANARAAKG